VLAISTITLPAGACFCQQGGTSLICPAPPCRCPSWKPKQRHKKTPLQRPFTTSPINQNRSRVTKRHLQQARRLQSGVSGLKHFLRTGPTALDANRAIDFALVPDLQRRRGRRARPSGLTKIKGLPRTSRHQCSREPTLETVWEKIATQRRCGARS
jgi:hypothetical protein